MRRLLGIAVLLLASLAWATNPKAAALAKDADKLYKDGKYAEAAELLKQAYDVDPNPLFIYNIARAWDQVGNVEKAVESYRQYIALPSDQTQPDLVKRANLSLDRLRNALAKAEAQKKIEDEKTQRLEDERNKAEQRAEQEAAAARKQREEIAAKEKREREAAARSTNGRKIAAFVTGGVGAALLATSLGVGLAANGSRTAFRNATTLEDKVRFESATKSQALATDLTLVAGVAAAVAAVIIFPKGGDAQGSVGVAVVPVSGGAVASVGVEF